MDDPVQWLQTVGAPAWIITAMLFLVVLGLFAKQIEGLQPFFASIAKLVSQLRRPERRQRVRLRRGFADHLESQIRLLNGQEEWADARFAELEAEIEFEGSTRSKMRFAMRSRGGVRRARSLSKALEASTERLIVLQGDPGSGKSVALRHMATRLAKRAATSASLKSILPVYVNLREWRISSDEEIHSEAVRDLVVNTLKRVNVREVVNFVDEEFDYDLAEGRWFFLFDSFDEIPGVLSSSEVDNTIKLYRDALYNFLNGVNTCRGIVASREFRGPSTYGLATFKIAPLSARRRMDLIRRAELPYETRRTLVAALPNAEAAIQQLVDNPMFLGLLCEELRDERKFPANSHTVFEDYVTRRLKRDSPSLARMFDISDDQLWALAEEIAFTLGVEPALGLSPSVDELAAAMARRNFTTRAPLTAGIKALAFTKLLRTDLTQQAADSVRVAFAHRRFQEYFATRVVLRDLTLVPPRILLKDARWRETTVTIFQTQPLPSIRPLIDYAVRSLDQYIRALKSASESDNYTVSAWPPGLMHVLGILDAGLVTHETATERIAKRVDAILGSIVERGILTDRKWAIDVAGTASETFRIELFRDAFKGDSLWLRTAAYRQLGRLRALPTDMSSAVRRTLTTLTQAGELRRDRLSVDAQLRRLNRPKDYLRCLHLLLVMPFLDFVLVFVAVSVWDYQRLQARMPVMQAILSVVAISAIIHMAFYVLRYMPQFSWRNKDRIAAALFASKRLGVFIYTIIRISPLIIPVLLFEFYPTYIEYGGYVFRDLSDLDSILGFFNMSSGGGITIEPIFLLLIFIYATCWAPGAMVAVRDGTMLGVLWWPVHPALLIYSASRSILVRLKLLIQSPKRIAVNIAKGIAWLLAIIGFLWLEFKLLDRFTEALSGGWTYLISALLVALFLIYSALRARGYVVDIFRLKALNDRATPSDVPSMISGLEYLNTSGARTKYVQGLRRKQALLPNEETIKQLGAMMPRSGQPGSHLLSSGRLRDEIAQLVDELNQAGSTRTTRESAHGGTT